MPLISCPECKKQISSSAIQCVHCGYPLSLGVVTELEKKNTKPKIGQVGPILISVLLAILALVIIFQNRIHEALTPESTSEAKQESNRILAQKSHSNYPGRPIKDAIHSPQTTNLPSKDTWSSSEVKEITESTVRNALPTPKGVIGSMISSVRIDRHNNGKYRLILGYSYKRLFENNMDFDLDIKNFNSDFTVIFSRLFANENVDRAQLNATQIFKSGKKRILLNVLYERENFTKNEEEIIDDFTGTKWILLKLSNQYSINPEIYKTLPKPSLKQLKP